MTTATYQSALRIEEAPVVTVTVAEPAGFRRRSPAPVLAMVAGAAVIVAAAVLTTVPGRSGPERLVRTTTAGVPGPSGPLSGVAGPSGPLSGVAGAASPAADPQGLTLAERDVSVVTQVYEPGHDSGWHSHAGIHAVAVISGELTVYDGECRASTFGPGRPYVGGREIHFVRNGSPVPVEMIVTYLNPSTASGSTRQHPAPPGCALPPA